MPVAPQQVFIASWLPAASALGLPWVELMETGFDVTPDNRAEVIDQLTRLRRWMTARGELHEIERLDRLVAELHALRFERGATAFLG